MKEQEAWMGVSKAGNVWRRALVALLSSMIAACLAPGMASAFTLQPQPLSNFDGGMVLTDKPELRFDAGIESIDFGSVPIRPFIPYNINTGFSNEGTAPARIDSISVVGPDADEFIVSASSDGCTSMPPLRFCGIQLLFNPRTEGPKDASLRIDGDLGQSSPILMPISAIGLPENRPRIEIEPAAVQFGLQELGGEQVTRDVVIRSTGERALQLQVGDLNGDTGFSVVSDNCPASLPVGETCGLQIGFDPFSLGTKRAAIPVSHNAFTGSFIELDASVVPKARISVRVPTRFGKGSIKVAVRVKNSGIRDLTGLTIETDVPARLAMPPKRLRIRSVAVGETVTRTVRVPVRQRAIKKKRSVTLRVSLRSGGEVLAKVMRRSRPVG